MAIIHLPDPGLFKGAKNNSLLNEDYLWLELEPRKILRQNFQNATFIQTTEPDGNENTYRFLFPRDSQETTNHQWSSLQNVIMKAAQTAASTVSGIELGYANFKVDTPLLYENSDNRNFTVLLQMVWTGKDTIENEIMNPIRDLQRWSAPQKIKTAATLNNALDPISLPYVVRVNTITGSNKPIQMFNVRTAALTSVQPVYKGPYVGGLPISAELNLSFTDIEPLSADTFSKNRFNITTSGL